MAGDINVVALVKGVEKYVFLFDEDKRSEALRTLGRYASSSELSFSWYDAAVLSQKMRRTGTDVSTNQESACNRVDDHMFDDQLFDPGDFPLLNDGPPVDDI